MTGTPAPLTFVLPGDRKMFATAPHYIDNSMLLDLASRYSISQIAQRINAAQKAPVVTDNCVKKRLYRSLARIAKRDRREYRDVKAAFDAARSTISKDRVDGRSRADSGLDMRSTSEMIPAPSGIVGMAGATALSSATNGGVWDDQLKDEDLMVIDEDSSKAQEMTAAREAKEVSIDVNVDDSGYMSLDGTAGDEVDEPVDTSLDVDIDESDLSDPPSDFDEQSDTDTVIDQETEAMLLEDRFGRFEVHGLFEKPNSYVDDDDVVQLCTLYTIKEIVDRLNRGGGGKYTAKDVQTRMNEAVGGLVKRKRLNARSFWAELEMTKVANGVAAREKAEVKKRRAGRK